MHDLRNSGAVTQDVQARSPHSAHASYLSRSSDTLSALNALLAFERAAPADDALWCSNKGLNIATMREMRSLHQQLHRLLSIPARAGSTGHAGAALLATGLDSFIDGSAACKCAPAKQEQRLLRRCVAAAWPDQIARRLTPSERVAKQTEKGKMRAVRYQTCSSEAAIHLHPRSTLHRTAPDFVVYCGLLSTEKRTYMTGVTGVDPAWLPTAGGALARLSTPLREPAPSYNAKRDAVLAWHEASYGMHAWALPLHADATERAAIFGAALLTGAVLPAFDELQPHYNCKPGMMAAREGRALRRLADIVSALQITGVDSLAALRKQWRTDEVWLKALVQRILLPSGTSRLDAAWVAALKQV